MTRYAKTLPLVVAALGAVGCIQSPEPVESKTTRRLIFEDRFDRKELGPNWRDMGGGYKIVDGKLLAKGARNSPLWLTKKLPRDAAVEFTARSESDAVDIKAELYGDGKSKPHKASYTATSYVVILGGWNNSRSVIARMNEHGKDREVRTSPKGERSKRYLFSIVRRGNRLLWSLDAKPFLEMMDQAPLDGSGHEYFAFNNWDAEVYFDDLRVYEL